MTATKGGQSEGDTSRLHSAGIRQRGGKKEPSVKKNAKRLAMFRRSRTKRALSISIEDEGKRRENQYRLLRRGRLGERRRRKPDSAFAGGGKREEAKFLRRAKGRGPLISPLSARIGGKGGESVSSIEGGPLLLLRGGKKKGKVLGKRPYLLIFRGRGTPITIHRCTSKKGEGRSILFCSSAEKGNVSRLNSSGVQERREKEGYGSVCHLLGERGKSI